MGGHISSLHRLRRQLIIQSYMRNTGDSIYSIFEKKSKHLTLNDFIQLFPDSKATFRSLFESFRFDGGKIPLHLVLQFLESGRLPLQQLEPNRCKKSERGKSIQKHNETRCDEISSLEDIDKSLVLYANDRDTRLDVTEGNGRDIESELENTFWKKHEIVITERIVCHTTVKNGVASKLVETDKSQNEVIHVECTSSGEFAHREYSQQEQTEELDHEMITFIRATEEYVHFKNSHDEYEYVHSNIPDTSNDEEADVDGNVFDDSCLDSDNENFNESEV